MVDLQLVWQIDLLRAVLLCAEQRVLAMPGHPGMLLFDVVSQCLPKTALVPAWVPLLTMRSCDSERSKKN